MEGFMRILIYVIAGFMAFAALAEDVGTVSSRVSSSDVVSSTNNFTELGMEYSSINNGTPYASIGLIHDFANGFSVGARGDMPLRFNSQSNSYLLQILGRFMMMNTVNQMYLEPTLTEAVFNGNNGAINFLMTGLNFGYNRVIAKDLIVGAHIGVDYASDRISQDQIFASERTLYSKLGVAGSYYF